MKLSHKDRLLQTSIELQHHKDDPTFVKFGDASIASPFTAKRTSIECVLSVLRRGRCTLVTTIQVHIDLLISLRWQVYKVLALNCLVSAYMMSSLYLRDLKHGDSQMTVTGLMVAALFYLISIAKPLTHLSETQPPGSVFDQSVLLSILGQFLVHLSSLVTALYLCDMKLDTVSLDNDYSLADPQFHPNLVNTTVYILYSTIQVNNFFVNYRGAPYTENIWDNRILSSCFLMIYGFLLLLLSGLIEPLNDLLQLVPFPSLHFQYFLAMILVGNLCLSFTVEKISQTLRH